MVHLLIVAWRTARSGACSTVSRYETVYYLVVASCAIPLSIKL